MKKNASKIKSHYINFFLPALVFAFLQISTTLQELIVTGRRLLKNVFPSCYESWMSRARNTFYEFRWDVNGEMPILPCHERFLKKLTSM